MSGQYTPGPWRVSTIGRRNDGSIAVMSERGPVAYANLLEQAKRDTAHCSTDSESEANARLISAAPDGYVAAVAAVATADENGPSGRVVISFASFESLKAFIAKTEGRS